MGESSGLARAVVAANILHELLNATKHYLERVMALKDVPVVNKKNLADRVKSLHARLAGAGGK